MTSTNTTHLLDFSDSVKIIEGTYEYSTLGILLVLTDGNRFSTITIYPFFLTTPLLMYAFNFPLFALLMALFTAQLAFLFVKELTNGRTNHLHWRFRLNRFLHNQCKATAVGSPAQDVPGKFIAEKPISGLCRIRGSTFRGCDTARSRAALPT